MASILEVTNGVTSLLPSTAWAAPNGLFGATADRNDGSAYGWDDSAAEITLPSSGLADGYLFLWGFEFEDTSAGRHNPCGRMIQSSGTGTFLSAQTSGYNRDNSEDRSYVSGWSFVDSPSASSTYTFQWTRDSDTPTGGTVRSYIQAVPFYYADIGMYSSSTAATYGGTTPNLMTGFTADLEGTNITISSNQISVTGDNKRYLVLASGYIEGQAGGTRTQRWYGLEIDGTFDDSAKGCCYLRNSSNQHGGESFIKLLETSTATRTVEMNSYRGDGVGAGQGGADSDGGGSGGSNAAHRMVVIELNDSAEVFASIDSVGGQEFALAGPVDVDIASTGDIEFSDSASFVRVDDNNVNCEVAMDVFAFANISHAREASSIGSGSRWTVHGEFTINGVEQTGVGFHGNYNRGNQSSADTFGSSTNNAGVLAMSQDEDIGISNQELSGTEGGGGDIETQAGWVGFGLINLDTLEASSDTNVATTTDALTLAEGQATIALDVEVVGVVDPLVLAEGQAGITLDVDVATTTDALTLAEGQAAITLDVEVLTSTDELVLAANQADIQYGVNVLTSTDALTLAAGQATITYDVDVQGVTDALVLSEGQATISSGFNVQTVTDALVLSEGQAQVAFDVDVQTVTDALVLSAGQAVITSGFLVETSTHALTLAEGQATITFDVSIGAQTAVLTIVTNQATISYVPVSGSHHDHGGSSDGQPDYAAKQAEWRQKLKREDDELVAAIIATTGILRK